MKLNQSDLSFYILTLANAPVNIQYALNSNECTQVQVSIVNIRKKSSSKNKRII